MNDVSGEVSDKSSINLMKQPPNELVTPPISNRPWQPFGGDINIIPGLNTKAKNTTSGSKGSSQYKNIRQCVYNKKGSTKSQGIIDSLDDVF